jgi:hypothetical protein
MGFSDRLQHPGWVGVILPLVLTIGSTFTPGKLRAALLVVAVISATWVFSRTPLGRERLWRPIVAFCVFLIIALGIFIVGQRFDSPAPNTVAVQLPQTQPQPQPQTSPPLVSSPASHPDKDKGASGQNKLPHKKSSEQQSGKENIQTGPITTTAPCSPVQVGKNNQATVNCAPDPNTPLIIYDFKGNKKVVKEGGTNVQVDMGSQDANYAKIQNLYAAMDWMGLRDFCDKQMGDTPEWLTPKLFAGIAYANLGDKTRAINLLTEVDKKAAGNPAYSDAGRLLKILQPAQ